MAVWAVLFHPGYLITGSVAAALGVALGYRIPVDHVPPGIEVFRSAVLVLEIVGMFPDIVPHDWIQTFRQWTVLVSSRHNLKFAIPIKNQPGPT